MNPISRTLIFALLPLSALAAEKPTLRYHPPAASDEDERPVATEVTVGPQGSDFAFQIRFDKVPWGEECKNRCANATFFVDTDDNPTTGLQLGKKAPETGADLAVTVQGVSEYHESSAEVLLRVKVRQLPDGATSVENGDTLAELDNRRDPERVQAEGDTVFILVDATSPSLPSGKRMRVIYHPPAAKPVVGKVKGMLAGASSKVEIFRKGKGK